MVAMVITVGGATKLVFSLQQMKFSGGTVYVFKIHQCIYTSYCWR